MLHRRPVDSESPAQRGCREEREGAMAGLPILDARTTSPDEVPDLSSGWLVNVRQSVVPTYEQPEQ